MRFLDSPHPKMFMLNMSVMVIYDDGYDNVNESDDDDDDLQNVS